MERVSERAGERSIMIDQGRGMRKEPGIVLQRSLSEEDSVQGGVAME